MSEEQKPWIVTGDRWEWSVKREGSDPDDSYFLAHYEEPESLAARLNDLDTARARIALLEARLDALCGAVEATQALEAEWQASGDDEPSEELDERADAALLDVDRATKAAREVLHA